MTDDEERDAIATAAASLEGRPHVAAKPLRATGWAVKTKAGIDVRSVQDSEVGAAVNWLHTDAGALPMGGLSNDAILGAFRAMAMCRADRPEIIRIEIRELLQ